ncbi:hypothetical protein N7474_010998 [Penicillium riverlandense]|uniref:uncharacterized protein n=1 Tax=Penicillium riverlandense TaxID=1903569 RepID=UPI002548D2D8|nr:uncharacterized protein N7474_010998 [Penicillium riverlandense]KAJ5805111.1 hypothetical protein N7474_010998 [Penicillium riverlandense]
MGDALKGFWIVQKDETSCHAPELSLLTEMDTLQDTPYDDDKGTKYSSPGVQAGAYVTVEHVYEIQFLKNFMVHLLESGAIDCDDLKTALFKEVEGSNIGTELWGKLPSDKNLNFEVLDSKVNDAKGDMFDMNKNGGIKNPKQLDMKVQQLNMLGMAFDFLQDSDVQEKFRDSNSGIYEYLRYMDRCDQQLPSPQGGWASAYSSWFPEYLTSKASVASNSMSARYAQATKMVEKYNDKDKAAKLSQGLKMFSMRYPSQSWSMDIDAMVSWPAYNVEKRGSACSLDPNPQGSSSSRATATPSSRNTLSPQPSPGSTPLSSRPTSTQVVVSQVTVNPTSYTSTVVVTPSPTPWVEDIPSVFINSIPPKVSSELADGDPVYGSESGIDGMLTLADGTLEFSSSTEVPMINPAFDGGA